MIEDGVKAAIAAADADRAGAIERWKAFLRIPSISTDPAYDGETRRAAMWLADELATMGFAARLVETAGQPMVLAHHDGPADAPHLLYYGHYDVQPADPLDLWDSPPFEPTIVDGPHGKRMVARGAVDDKGQLLTFIEAFRAWKSAHGDLPIRVTAFFEGEEESGSASMAPFLAAHREELAADVAVVSDTGMIGPADPAITTSLRGMVYLEFRLKGPSHDLHSGHFGGAVANPANLLASILGAMIDADGRIQIPGMYDDVRDAAPATLEAWRRSIPISERAFLADAGLGEPAGERGRDHFEKTWSRPSLDVNGLWSGYQGAGAKTIIPSEAGAKLSCRLVPDQDHAKIAAAIEAFVRARIPADFTLEVIDHGGGAPIAIDVEGPFVQAASRAAARIFQKEPVMIGCGGSIPVVADMKAALGLDSVLLGFGLADDRLHSPNEKFELLCFERGIRTHIALLGEAAAFQEKG